MIAIAVVVLLLAILLFQPHWILGNRYKKMDSPKKEPKVYEPTFVLSEHEDCKLSRLIEHSVNWTVKYMNDCYFDCDKANVWTASINNFQLKGKMERMVKLNYTGMNEKDGKEMVRELIKEFHLRTIEKYPELKEYK